MHDKIFYLKPWTPKIQETAQKLITKIHKATPELEVLFMGSAALGLPGKNDIDLDILCDVANIKAYTTKLLPILGQPKEINNSSVSWQFELEEFAADIILSDPNTSHVPLQRKRFEILKADAGLRDEYKRLKEECNGLPYAEYEKRKIAFLKKRIQEELM